MTTEQHNQIIDDAWRAAQTTGTVNEKLRAAAQILERYTRIQEGQTLQRTIRRGIALACLTAVIITVLLKVF